MTADSNVDLRLNSSEFDAFLVLLDATGAVVDEDDDSGGNTNSRITRDLQAGTYYMVVEALRRLHGPRRLHALRENQPIVRTRTLPNTTYGRCILVGRSGPRPNGPCCVGQARRARPANPTFPLRFMLDNRTDVHASGLREVRRHGMDHCRTRRLSAARSAAAA